MAGSWRFVAGGVLVGCLAMTGCSSSATGTTVLVAHPPVVAVAPTSAATTALPDDGQTLALGCSAMTNVWVKLTQAVAENSWRPWSALRDSAAWADVAAMVGAPSSPPFAQIVGNAIQLTQDVDGANVIADLGQAEVDVAPLEQDCRQLGLPIT